MPEIKNCRKCKKIFMYATGSQICDVCKKAEEEEFDRVRIFLRDFPGASIQEVSESTEVSTQLIYKFLKDGRIEVSESSAIALQCENCGVRVTSGRFCLGCSKKLANEMMSTGRNLKDSLDKKNEKHSEEKDIGLRYMHEYKRD